MDPRLVKAFLVLPLGACQTLPASAPQQARFVRTYPVERRPELPELPEDSHPAHGEGSGESWMFVGENSSNVSNTASVSVHSVSGFIGDAAPPVTWLRS